MNSKRIWTRRLVLLLVAGLAVLYMLYWFEHQQVFHPSRTLDVTGAALGRPYEDVTLNATDGIRLNGWFFPASLDSARKDLVVLVCHGNGGNISHRLGLAQALLGTGVNVFLLDYRGYGRSEGHPSEQGTCLDAHAAYGWLRSRNFPPGRIVVFGESLGGGVAAELAVSSPVGGLILQSTFTSIPDIGAELFPWLPVRRIARIRYDTFSRLPDIRVPVLIMHSRADELVPYAHSQKNFAAANEPKLFWEIRGGHNDPLADRERFVAGIDKLLSFVPK